MTTWRRSCQSNCSPSAQKLCNPVILLACRGITDHEVVEVGVVVRLRAAGICLLDLEPGNRAGECPCTGERIRAGHGERKSGR